MPYLKFPAVGAVGCAVALLLVGTVRAQSFTVTAQEMEARVEALSQELAEQKKRLVQLESIRQQYAEQRGLLASLERQLAQQQLVLDELRGTASWDLLAAQRGAGKVGEPQQLAQAQSKEATPVALVININSRAARRAYATNRFIATPASRQ